MRHQLNRDAVRRQATRGFEYFAQAASRAWRDRPSTAGGVEDYECLLALVAIESMLDPIWPGRVPRCVGPTKAGTTKSPPVQTGRPSIGRTGFEPVAFTLKG